jgi:hypothetical protein
VSLAGGVLVVVVAAALVWVLICVADLYLRRRYRDPDDRMED